VSITSKMGNVEATSRTDADHIQGRQGPSGVPSSEISVGHGSWPTEANTNNYSHSIISSSSDSNRSITSAVHSDGANNEGTTPAPFFQLRKREAPSLGTVPGESPKSSISSQNLGLEELEKIKSEKALALSDCFLGENYIFTFGGLVLGLTLGKIFK
jgi:hypothetical protein